MQRFDSIGLDPVRFRAILIRVGLGFRLEFPPFSGSFLACESSPFRLLSIWLPIFANPRLSWLRAPPTRASRRGGGLCRRVLW
eukprot:6013588-Pyramimonas_sp.AAC.1